MSFDSRPNLTFVVPGANENRWSDLLASLIATDPVPIARMVGGEPDMVERELVIRGEGRRSGRLDVVLSRGNETVAAIEVKRTHDQSDRFT